MVALPHLLQLMLLHAVSTWMMCHLLCTSIHQQITKIICTAQVVQLALAHVESLSHLLHIANVKKSSVFLSAQV